MIIVTWRFTTTPGGWNKGLEFAKRVMASQKKGGFIPPKWWILRPRTGDNSRFSVVGEFASYAEFEKYAEKRDSDSGYQAQIKEMGESDWFTGVETTINQVIEEG